MALSTDTYWEIDGIPLQTMAYNIVTGGGNLWSPPPLRGEGIVVPYRPGAMWLPRQPDVRTITLQMWVIGADVDGNVPASMPMRQQFEAHLNMLQNLLWQPGRQFVITKRWKEGGSPVVKMASALGTYDGGFAPAMNGGARATFSVDIRLDDPFFYGPEATVNFVATATSTQTVNILGDYETTAMTLLLNGARTNPRLTNMTNQDYMHLQHTIGGSDTVLIDVNNWTARKNPSSTDVNVIKDIQHMGGKFWFSLPKGSQQLRITSSSGSAAAVLKYFPRYI